MRSTCINRDGDTQQAHRAERRDQTSTCRAPSPCCSSRPPPAELHLPAAHPDLHLQSSISLLLIQTSRRVLQRPIMTPAALLLLLAAAASQVDSKTTLTAVNGNVDISGCPITFYGQSYSWLEMKFDSRFSLCFKKTEKEVAKDCVSMESGAETDSVATLYNTLNEKKPGSNLHKALPTLKSATTCFTYFRFTSGGASKYYFNLYNAGTQAALRIARSGSALGPATLKTTINGVSQDSKTFSDSILANEGFMDLSSCRLSGGEVLAARTGKPQIDTCSSSACSASAVLTSSSICKASEVCLGNNKCVTLPSVCTVTGSSIIDFHGRLISIKDRCAYVLMKHISGFGSDISAGFLERRRTDVSHLDQLLIVHSNKKFVLGQGGTVVVEGKTLKLSTTPQEVHGVKLSKDVTGVNAELLSTKLTVFFDGNTAQVSGSPVGVEGLCGNPSDKDKKTAAAAMKTVVADCATLHKDAADSTIDCKSSTERCNLLKQAPFTAGHKVTDPQPFVDACKETLCKYPAVDGLKCQFMEAYAESCRLKGVNLGDWRSKVNCPVPQASCLQHHCSEHEFCGDKLGERHCFCRALFSSKYTSALGEPTVCKKDSATVSLAGCLLQEKGIDYSVLHLKDPSCKGLMDKDTHMVTFSFNSTNACGTKVSTTNTQILYENAIVTRDASKAGIITRHDQVKIDFSCLYKKPDITNVSFKIQDSSVVKEIVSGDWKYTLTMNVFADAGLKSLIPKSTAVRLDQQVWVELKTQGLDGDMVSVVTDSCWATSKPQASGSARYDLVKDGCPNKADGTVKMEGNGKATSTAFCFNMFEFSGEKSEIYLHCKLELCPKKGSVPCTPVCGSKRKRRSSGSADGNPALITMAWSN